MINVIYKHKLTKELIYVYDIKNDAYIQFIDDSGYDCLFLDVFVIKTHPYTDIFIE